jgi:hypothetical protein
MVPAITIQDSATYGDNRSPVLLKCLVSNGASSSKEERVLSILTYPRKFEEESHESIDGRKISSVYRTLDGDEPLIHQHDGYSTTTSISRHLTDRATSHPLFMP